MQQTDAQLRQALHLPVATTDPSWLVRMDRITDWLVAFGKSVRSTLSLVGGQNQAFADRDSPSLSEELSNIAVFPFFSLKITQDYAYDVIQEMLYSDAIGGMLSLWEIDVVKIYGEQASYLPYVMASKTFFDMCLKMEITADAGGKVNREASVALELKVANLGGGKSGKTSLEEGVGSKATIAGCWVTLIELCDICIRRLAPTKVPEIADSIELFNHGLFTLEQFNGFVRYAGGLPNLWEAVASSRAEKLQWRELVEFGFRKGMDWGQIDYMLLDRGMSQQKQRDMAHELYWEVPSIIDHLHWLQRNVDDFDYVQKYKLLDGFAPEQFIRMLPGLEQYTDGKTAGNRDFWKVYGSDLTIKGMRKVNAAYHYAAHWIQPAPTQMLEFLYRLRADRPGGGISFSLDDYKRILTEQDYAPLAREWFAATAYRVPALGYIRDMYRQGVIEDGELVGYHQDLGYTEADSKRFLGVDSIEKARLRSNASAGWTPRAIGNAVVLGQMTRQQAVQRMATLGWTAQETDNAVAAAQARVNGSVFVRAKSRLVMSTIRMVREAIDVGVMDVSTATEALQNIGWPLKQASGIAQMEASLNNTRRVKSVVSQIRSAYHRGEIDAAYVQHALQTLGIIQGTIASYLAMWNLQNTPGRKRRTATQIVSDIVEHGLPIPEATARLRLLGYQDYDIQLFLADARRKLITEETALVAASEMHGSAKISELNALSKNTLGLNKRIVNEIMRELPPARIQKWLGIGLMKPDEAARYLSLYGWDERAIQLWIEEGMAGGAKTPKAAEAEAKAVAAFDSGAATAGK